MDGRRSAVVGVLAVVIGLWGCEAEDEGGEGGRADDPVAVSRALEGLAERLDEGADVTRAQFDDALAPLRWEAVKTWPDAELMRLMSALIRVRAALLKRFPINDELCTSDTWERYSLCDDGLPCLIHAHTGELRCLWFFSH